MVEINHAMTQSNSRTPKPTSIDTAIGLNKQALKYYIRNLYEGFDKHELTACWLHIQCEERNKSYDHPGSKKL